MKRNYLFSKPVFAILFAAALFSKGVNAQPYDKKMTPNVTAGTQEGEACLAINPTDSNLMAIGFMESSSTLDF